MKKNYTKGTLFYVELDDGSFCLGLVVLDSGQSNVIVCRFATAPVLAPSHVQDLPELSINALPIALRCGDAFIRTNRWKVIGALENFDAHKWLPDSFVEGPDLADRYWSITYTSNALAIETRTELIATKPTGPTNNLYGPRAAEIELTTALCGQDKVNARRTISD